MDVSGTSSFSPAESLSSFINSTNALNSELDNKYLTKEIVFLDSSVDNYLELAKELKADEVILLQPNEDGVEQITAALAKYHNLSSVQIVSHGSSANLLLGNSQLGADDLINYAGAIQRWANALSADADILLYGCNVASGVAGVSFINRLSQLTGADVAASDDLTGKADLGGDWTLEVTTGAIEADSALSAKAMEEYDSILPTYNGNEYILTSASLTWEQAQAEARSRGGNLVTINNAAEETWLKQTFGTTTKFWIGINDRVTEGQFVWASGEAVTYTNWAPGEPNNWQGNQDFGVMNFGSSRRWDDDSPTALFRGIIEISGTQTNAGAISLTNNSFTVNENNNTINVTVQRTGGSEGTVTVGYRTANGTAIAGSDYTAATGTLTFGQGETSKTVTISILDDTAFEANETFNFTLENVTGGATLSTPNTAAIAIVDNDPLIYNGDRYFLTSGALTWEQAQAEAQSRGGNLVTINNAAEETWLRQTFGTTEGFWIGINDRDVEGQFRWVSGEAVTYTNWAPGEPNNWQGNQDFGRMNFGSSRRWDDDGPTARFRGIIEVGSNTQPNPGTIGLSDSNFSVTEGNNTVTVTILRTGGSDGTVTVDYRTVEGSATAGTDYTAIGAGTVTFAPGETSKTVTIAIADDTIAEGNETFGFAIDNVTGGATLLVPRTAQVTIVDNEGQPNIFTYNGNQYLLTSGALTWEQAQAEAQSRGGNLVTINDLAEETWLKQIFGTSESLWIGINDRAVEGQFQWVSGQAVTYTNWAPGEPNNYLGNQDFGAMNFGTSRRWDDDSPTALYRGIIEIGGANPSPNNPPTLTRNTVVSGLVQPTAIDWTPDGQTMFIAQKDGIVRVFRNGTLQSTPFIDIRSQVNNTRDRGLLDIAVHPDFQNNPYVYLLFTYDDPQVFQNLNNALARPDGNGNRMGRLIRVTVNTTTWTAIAGSEVILLGNNGTWNVDYNPFVDSTENFNAPPAGVRNWPNPNPQDGRGLNPQDWEHLQDFLAADSTSHTIGTVEFGRDGMLYVSNGDGTSYNRMDARTVLVQDLNSPRGKILRIDPITGRGLSNNPFYNGNPNSNISKVYQYGLRNPFRFTIDPTNNRLFIGDVGWTRWEEINSAGAGANFGWPYYEGGSGQNLRTSNYQDLELAQAFYNSGQTATPAIYALNHDTGINAIVMGDVYTGNLYPEQYRGDLFFNDLGRGIVRNVSFDAQGRITSVETFATGANIVVQIATGPDGRLFFVDLDGGFVGAWQFV
jgi:glucose/arabinose dehydrogenase